MKKIARNNVFRRSAFLLALLIAVMSVFCACGSGNQDASQQTVPPAEATPDCAEPTPAPTEEITPTPAPPGPFELFDYVGEPDENTAAKLSELVSKLPNVVPVASQQFPGAYYLGMGIELGLDLDADEFSPIFLCHIEGNDILSIGGIRCGMELDELKSVCPGLLVMLEQRSAYYDYSDTAGLELTFDSDYRVDTITYSVTGEGEGF